jgi:putative ABC transport system substrate-binding protein
VFDLARPMADLGLLHRLPVMHASREEVEAGGLIAYGTDRAAQHRQAAGLVYKVLSGARPADLPVEQATHIMLTLNLKTARALGLSLPASILARADEVIE